MKQKISLETFLLMLTLIAALTITSNPFVGIANATIYIKADGSIDPQTTLISTSDNITYTFKGNIDDSIVIERDNIMIDGANHTVEGAGTEIGIHIPFRNNVTITNVEAKTFSHGIYVYYSRDILIYNTTVRNNEYGILISYSSNTTLANNRMLNNRYNFSVKGASPTHFDNNIDLTNIADDKLVYYVKNASSITFDPSMNVATLYVINCTDITVKDLSLTKNYVGIYLLNTNNSRIENITVDNSWGGVTFSNSINNTLINSIITNNDQYGIELYDSARNNNVTKNLISHNKWCGIWLHLCYSNRIHENTVINNELYGIKLYYACNNIIYHNNFVNNTRSKFVEPLTCYAIWDDGYPSGGNYWSDHESLDKFHGPSQNVPGSDGICDTSYNTSKASRDRYPLMRPWILLAGDLNQDRKVTLEDLVLLAKAYDSLRGDPNWNSFADIASPYDKISLSDVVRAAYNYGKHYP